MKKGMLSIISLSVLSSAAVAAPLFNVVQNPNGSAMTISTIPAHTYPSAGIKLNTPGYILDGGAGFTSNSQCIPNRNGYCLFSVSNTMPKTITYSGVGGTALNFSLCLNGKAPQSCQNFSVAPNSHFLYVTNDASSTVSVCTLNGAGLINTCVDAGADAELAGSSPQGIALNASHTIAYITQGFGSPFVYQCVLNTDGTFNFCSKVTITDPPGVMTNYGMIAINPSNTLAFVFDSAHTQVLACPLIAGSIDGNCTNTGATGFGVNLVDITLSQDGSTAYLSDYIQETVTVCSVNDATFSSCVTKTGGGAVNFDGPAGVALNNAQTIAYIPNYYASTVYGCSTTPNNTARFDNCFVATSALSNVWGIALNATGSVAYVTTYANTTYQCPILADGTFSACTATTGFDDSVGVAVA